MILTFFEGAFILALILDIVILYSCVALSSKISHAEEREERQKNAQK